MKCARQPGDGWRETKFLAIVLIYRAGKVFSSSADSFFVSRFCQQISIVSRFVFCQQILSADFYRQQICLLSADSVSRFPYLAVFLFVSRFLSQDFLS
jgi:hypothetical protein